MTSLEQVIRESAGEGDIPFGGEVYQDVARNLIDMGVNLAFFVFESSSSSAAARTLRSGEIVRCPSLTLYVKFDDDLRQTGIDPHRGNWDDQWNQTPAVRQALNSVLERHHFGSEFVSANTFVFVESREALAFRHIGSRCKSAVRDLVSALAPGVEVAHVFWNGSKYDVILRQKNDIRRVRGTVESEVSRALPRVLAAADEGRLCTNYRAAVEFGHIGMNLFHLEREDC